MIAGMRLRAGKTGSGKGARRGPQEVRNLQKLTVLLRSHSNTLVSVRRLPSAMLATPKITEVLPAWTDPQASRSASAVSVAATNRRDTAERATWCCAASLTDPAKSRRDPEYPAVIALCQAQPEHARETILS
jgi:hypothetical protein